MFAKQVASAYETVVISGYTANAFREVAGDHCNHFILYPCISEIFLTQSVNQRFQVKQCNEINSVRGGQVLKFITVARISEIHQPVHNYPGESLSAHCRDWNMEWHPRRADDSDCSNTSFAEGY